MKAHNTDHWFQQPCAEPKQLSREQAQAHQLDLTKPAGSLGMLEDIAVLFCAWQGTNRPRCETIQICVFAGDHGVCAQGVSAFPQEVTAQMIHNFVAGGAAISVIAHQLGADFSVINMGITSQLDDAPSLVNTPLVPGTQDFTIEPAMSEKTMLDALELGRKQVTNRNTSADLFIGGDMGIGNTTSASAIYSALLDLSPEITVGPGTGVNQQGILTKQSVITKALQLHQQELKTPFGVLQRLGGLEIAGLVGAYIACAQQGVPILIDGFIATSAALIACRMNPACRDWMLFGHRSAEPAHEQALIALNAKPILDIGMRLGEGSGAAAAVSLIQTSLQLHNNMATFSNAGVSESEQ